jgi:arabinogalactan endo-1,4-beta-galactosidase
MKDKWGTGSSWDNCTLFDFVGNALYSMDYMKSAYHF